MASRSRVAGAQQVLLLLCFLPSLLSSHGAQAKVEELTLYVHEDRVPGPSATLITVLTTSGNLSEVGFGTIQVFSNTLREGAESTSASMGVEPGFVTIGTQNVFISYAFTLNTPIYNGTICVQGQFAFNAWPRELAVVGGTGSFRFANGYDVSSIVDESDLGDYVTVHNIYLKYVS
ncbi:unnamed protein product [Calypogeia fissa]